MKLQQPEQAFYEWFHENGKRSISVEAQRELFIAGWSARAAWITAEED